MSELFEKYWCVFLAIGICLIVVSEYFARKGRKRPDDVFAEFDSALPTEPGTYLYKRADPDFDGFVYKYVICYDAKGELFIEIDSGLKPLDEVPLDGLWKKVIFGDKK